MTSRAIVGIPQPQPYLLGVVAQQVNQRAEGSPKRLEGVHLQGIPTETHPLCSSKAAADLWLIITRLREMALIVGWCEDASRAGVLAPWAALPQLLRFGDETKAAQSAIVPVLGTRGLWLAKHMAMDWVHRPAPPKFDIAAELDKLTDTGLPHVRPRSYQDPLPNILMLLKEDYSTWNSSLAKRFIERLYFNVRTNRLDYCQMLQVVTQVAYRAPLSEAEWFIEQMQALHTESTTPQNREHFRRFSSNTWAAYIDDVQHTFAFRKAMRCALLGEAA